MNVADQIRGGLIIAILIRLASALEALRRAEGLGFRSGHRRLHPGATETTDWTDRHGRIRDGSSHIPISVKSVSSVVSVAPLRAGMHEGMARYRRVFRY